MNIHNSTNHHPIIVQPSCVCNSEINATVAHGGAEIAVPVCAMQPITIVEIHYVWHIWQVVSRSRHVGITISNIDLVGPGDGGMLPGASRDVEDACKLTTSIGVGGLHRKVDIHPRVILAHACG